MLGELITKIRKDKKISKALLAREAHIDTGHVSHIEKGDRTPSHKSLKKICDCFEIPYQPLMYTYDKEFTQEQLDYNIENKICYDRILAVNKIDALIQCPENMRSASLAIRVPDDSMEPILTTGSYAFVELNTPLNSKDIGLFNYKNEYLFRRLIVRKDNLVLRALKDGIADIKIRSDEPLLILGKVLGTNDI